MVDLTALATVTSAQNGLFRADQARALGISREWIGRRVGIRLSVLLPRVYWTETGPPPGDVMLDAALLYGGEGSALSHWTAGEACKIRTEKRIEIHITTAAKHQVRSVTGRLVAHRSPGLGDKDVRTRGGRTLTTVERTVVDIASCTSNRREVRALVADTVQRGLTTPSRLANEMAERPSLTGVALLTDVLIAVKDGARSVLEIELGAHISSSSLSAPIKNAPVRGVSGNSYVADLLWPLEQLIVEVDGREWHLYPDAWESDLARTADLAGAGYTVLRFTAKAIRRRAEATIGVISRALEKRVTIVGA